MQRRREEFLSDGFTEGCPGCQAAPECMSLQGHSEKNRARVEDVVKSSPEGQLRVARQVEKENEKLARKLEEPDARQRERGQKRGGRVVSE